MSGYTQEKRLGASTIVRTGSGIFHVVTQPGISTYLPLEIPTYLQWEKTLKGNLMNQFNTLNRKKTDLETFLQRSFPQNFAYSETPRFWFRFRICLNPYAFFLDASPTAHSVINRDIVRVLDVDGVKRFLLDHKLQKADLPIADIDIWHLAKVATAGINPSDDFTRELVRIGSWQAWGGSRE